MPSPFPGMDPYLEGEEWSDFHGRFNFAMSDQLNERVGEDYFVRAERRVYVDEGGDERLAAVPDNVVFEARGAGGFAGGVAVAAPVAEAVPCTIPVPTPRIERRETYLVVRRNPGRKVVTIIETLSPANKRGGEGRRQFLAKRDETLAGPAHWVEIDLLRGGDPLPLGGTIPPHTYRAVVSRAYDRPRCELYPWTLADPLPTIPTPLKREDGQVPLDLQSVFETIFRRTRYDRALAYERQPEHPFTPAQAAFARTLPGVLTAEADAPLQSAATQ